LNKILINPKNDLVFNMKAREMCRSCKRYGRKATCPPYIEPIEYYEELLPQFEHGILFVEIFHLSDNQLVKWKEIGAKSSLRIHREILSERDRLLAAGHYFVVGFGAGSCKLCDKCTFPCRIPQKALIPFEGAGVDVVEMLKRFGIMIRFPVRERFYRVGALFYD